MKHRFSVCFTSPLVLALAGACAAPSQSAKSPSPPGGDAVAVVTTAGNTVRPKVGDELICEYEETVGSHIPKRICRSKAELEFVRQETQDLMHNLRPTPPKTGN